MVLLLLIVAIALAAIAIVFSAEIWGICLGALGSFLALFAWIKITAR